MRVLFDQGTPAPLRRALSAHDCETAFERGWSALKNGALINEAEAVGQATVGSYREVVITARA